MRTTSRVAISALAAMVLLLTGCTTNTGGPVSGVNADLTLEQAKQIAMAMELELADMVPADSVASIEQRPTGVLMSCDDERGYQWSGGTNVVLTGPVDDQALVDEVVARYEDRDGFSARSRSTYDGTPGAQVIGEYGAGYIIAASVDETSIEIVSFSPCFVLPEDVSPSGQY